MRVAWVYDVNACWNPTGVTRHALAQLDGLSSRSDVDLTVVSGKVTVPVGVRYWSSLGAIRRRELPLSMRTCLRYWRLLGRPALERWTGSQDWVYCPAEYYVPTRRARFAVTSHDALQGVLYDNLRRRDYWRRIFREADLVLSVSRFNSDRLLEHFPVANGKVAQVFNSAEDLFFEPPTPEERSGIRGRLGLPPGVPYLISVANFQPRKNLSRLVRAVARLREVARGELALVLVGSGAPSETQALLSVIDEAKAETSSRCRIVLPGYLQGETLRAAYAESTALVFPSLCESFGIPTVEAMAQGIPVCLAESTALPEIGGDAGWYFDPLSEESLSAALRELLDRADETRRRAELGRTIASAYRWESACDVLVEALRRAS